MNHCTFKDIIFKLQRACRTGIRDNSTIDTDKNKYDKTE